MYVNENLRFAEGNKSCVHLPCRVSFPQLVSGWVYLLLAEPVKSITYNCFKESDIVIQLSRMFLRTKSFKRNAFSLGWRFCQDWFPCLGVGMVIAAIRHSFYWWCNALFFQSQKLFILIPLCEKFWSAFLSCLVLAVNDVTFFYSDQRQLSGSFIFSYLYICIYYYFHIQYQNNFGNVQWSLFLGWAVILASYLTPPVCMTCE